jgi:hypothetical protein
LAAQEGRDFELIVFRESLLRARSRRCTLSEFLSRRSGLRQRLRLRHGLLRLLHTHRLRRRRFRLGAAAEASRCQAVE